MVARQATGVDLALGCLPVPSPGPGVCRICCAGTHPGYAMCGTCRRVATALHSPPLPVTPMSLATAASPLYRALRQYKSGEVGVARRQRHHLGSLLRTFADRHLACLAPCGVDAIVVVPSGDRRRPPPHPLVELVGTAGHLAPVAPLLTATSAVDHGRPVPDAYRAAGTVAGLAVLLVDDVYTTGAHLQSAALALLAGGARSVHPLVLGRYLDAERPPSGSVLAMVAGRTWNVGTCVRCDERPSAGQ